MNFLLLATLVGCKPDHAEVSGDWFVWLAASSSPTVIDEKLKLTNDDKKDISGNAFALSQNGHILGDELPKAFPRLTDGNATIFECSGRGWDPDTCMFDPGYIGSESGYFDVDNDGVANDILADHIIGGDCRRTNAEGNFNPDLGKCDGFFENLDIYNPDLPEFDPDNPGLPNDSLRCGTKALEIFELECESFLELKKNTWIQEDGYYGLSGEIDAWRSEALINSEGDLQLTIHVDIGDGEDFRFAWSIDPDFAPDDCLENENGDLERQYMDGSNWLNEWSEDEDGNLIYYLNAGAYQVDPNDSEISWYLSNDMLSGYSFAKFGSEEFSSHPAEYGHYALDGSPLPWGVNPMTGRSLEGGFLGVSVEGHGGQAGMAGDEDYVDWYEEYLANEEALCNTVLGERCDSYNGGDFKSWEDEFLTLGAASMSPYGIDGRGEARFEHKIESNLWRPIDNTVSGLDGWMEVHSSWVRLQTGQTVAPGERVKGDYQIFYEGTEAGSRLLVRGEFEITELQMDEWGYEILEDAKREANDTPYCGGAAAPEEVASTPGSGELIP